MGKTKELATTEELTLIDPLSFIALQPDNEAVEAMADNMLPGEGMRESDLVHVPTPSGGGTTWVYQVLGNEVTTKALRGILVSFAQRSVLWPSQEPSDAMPVLISDDTLYGRRVGDFTGDLDPAVLDAMLIRTGDHAGLYDWRSPSEGGPNVYNEYGSSGKGAGKRCKDSRVMFLLTESSVFPLVVRAQPGSLGNVVPFIKNLPKGHYRSVIELSLEKVKNPNGQEYSRIVPRYVGDIGKESGAVIKRTYTEPLRVTARRLSAGNDSTGGLE